jgi:prepilin-type N-terminal cleavage/methylation domain-containing protein
MRNSTQRNVARPFRTGFTVTELVVVVAIIGLIVALIIPTIGKVRAKSRTLKCLTNQRTITLANYSYAMSNAGKLSSPRTDDGGFPVVDSLTWRMSTNANNPNLSPSSPPMAPAPSLLSPPWSHTWVKAQGTNLAPGGAFELPASIEQGVLFPYVGQAKSYVSPDEPTNPLASTVGTLTTRVRSYSMNSFLGATHPDELPEFDDDCMASMYGEQRALGAYNTVSVSQVKAPSRMMATIVEDDTVAYNNQGWVVMPQLSSWTDWPAPWRPDAITFSYVDGSTDSYELANRDLPVKWEQNGHRWVQPNETTVDESGQPTGSIVPPDWKFFRDRLNPGVIPNSTYLFGN